MANFNFTMKGYKIFLSWLLTVVIGSLGLPIWAGVFESYGTGGFHINHIGELLMIAFLCMLVSAVLSAPTLIVLLIRNGIMNRRNYTLRKHFRRINVTHLIMAVLTIFAMAAYLLISYLEIQNSFNSLSGESSRINYLEMSLWPILTFTGVIVWYLVCAVPSWYLIFRKELREARTQEEPGNSTVLDNLE